jgi:hypothetical protein
MRSRVVLIDLPKGSRLMIEHYHLPSEQTAWAAPYRGREGKLRSRKNANRRTGIFWRSKSDSTGMKVLGSQFLARLSRTGLYVIGHALTDLLRCFQRRPPDSRIARGALWFPPRQILVERAASGYDSGWLNGDGSTSLHCATLEQSPRIDGPPYAGPASSVNVRCASDSAANEVRGTPSFNNLVGERKERSTSVPLRRWN